MTILCSNNKKKKLQLNNGHSLSHQIQCYNIEFMHDNKRKFIIRNKIKNNLTQLQMMSL